MKKFNILIASSIIIIVIAGCATVGKNFRYTNVGRLQIGTTKVSEYEALFGKPKSTSTITTSNGKVDFVQYVYVSVNLAGGAGRSLSLEFKDGILNSYVYNSGFEKDSTDFDFGAVDKIEIGESSENDVIRYLGPPNSKGYCPTKLINYKGDCKNGYKILAWVHTTKSKGILNRDSVKSKNALVVFDEKGKVIDIQSSKEH